MYQILRNFKDGTIACDGFTDDECHTAEDCFNAVIECAEARIEERGSTPLLSVYLIECEWSGWMRIVRGRIF